MQGYRIYFNNESNAWTVEISYSRNIWNYYSSFTTFEEAVRAVSTAANPRVISFEAKFL
jgi:hypothetical protein